MLLLQMTAADVGEWAFVFLFIIIVGGLWIWSIIWAYRDAERRGKSGVLVALMVAFVSWPFSLLIWLVFRPEDIDSRPAA